MKNAFYILALCLLHTTIFAQLTLDKILTPTDTLSPKRVIMGSSAIGTAYTGISIGLYHAWYKNYEMSGLHSFDDYGEWLNIDKAGHSLTTYYQTRSFYTGARWAGINEKTAIWTGAGIGMLLQTTLEVMDGFSAKWGFSWADMAFNTLGSGLFIGQQYTWQEQRIIPKISAYPSRHPNPTLHSPSGATTHLHTRVNHLFGRSYAEQFLKDYNNQTYWLSFNINSFIPNSRLPQWLNIAVGYGGQNIYGGFSNSWVDDKGNTYSLSPTDYPRYRQYYLSLDIDLTKIPTKKRWLKTTFLLLNFIKIPSPTLEINSLKKVRFHGMYW